MPAQVCIFSRRAQNADVAIDLVTGAFGYTGSRIAARLVACGRTVRTITRRAGGGPADGLGPPIDVRAAAYDDPLELRRQLDGIERLFVTYWMRFPRQGVGWEQVVANVDRLVSAAAEAGVRRIVLISVSNAAPDASTAYFRAKAAAEGIVRASGLSHAIVRPTLLYGPSDILINNMAWTLRRLPVFGIPGDGRYRVQPVHVDDVAELCVRLGDSAATEVHDAAGPEIFTFNELVAVVRNAIGSRARLVHLPTSLVLATTTLLGLLVRDVVLTRDELRELSESLLVARDPSFVARPTVFSAWLRAHAGELGVSYSSELGRNFRLARAR